MVFALTITLVLVVAGAVLLVRGSDWLIDGIGDLARLLGVSAVVLGAVLAGLEPEEMLTAAIASGRGASDLAVGDVIGTNVTIVTVALGLSALLTPIVMPRSVRRQALLATVVSAFPVGLLVFGYVSRLAGVLLLLAFVAYTILLFRIDPAALATLEEGDGDDDAPRTDRNSTAGTSERATNPGARRRAVALTLGGLLAIAVGGPALVEGALRLASLVGVGKGVIGLTIVSLGTGAEMIALGVSAARKHSSEVLVGGILGSFAYNLLVTLGLAAVVRPLPVDPHLTRIALPVMVAAHLALLNFVWRGQMSRLMGALFVIAYAGYLVTVVAAH